LHLFHSAFHLLWIFSLLVFSTLCFLNAGEMHGLAHWDNLIAYTIFHIQVFLPFADQSSIQETCCRKDCN
jgi:hypothetical protein